MSGLRDVLAAIVSAREAIEDGDPSYAYGWLERAEGDLAGLIEQTEAAPRPRRSDPYEEAEGVLARLARAEATGAALQRALRSALSELRADRARRGHGGS